MFERMPFLSTRLALAWVHLLALAIGTGGVWARGRALRDSLRDPEDRRAIRRALIGDTWWGIAAVLWLVTGLWRLLGSTEKSTSYYMGNAWFFAKMGGFLAILALELWPMRTLIRWRRGTEHPNPRDAGRIEIISYVQVAIIMLMVLAAAGMARGYGMTTGSRPAAAPIAADSTVAADSPIVAAPSTKQDSVPSDSLLALGTPTEEESPGAVAPVAPSGSEVATPADLSLLASEIAMPLAGIDAGTLRSNFNESRGGGRPHHALDIMAPRGTPVLSAASGRVLKLFTSKAGGLMVYAADSSERFILMYAHLDRYEPTLREGSRLTRGQRIGFVGFTGNASPSAPHLHFAIARSADVKRWSKGTAVDPLPALQQARR